MVVVQLLAAGDLGQVLGGFRRRVQAADVRMHARGRECALGEDAQRADAIALAEKAVARAKPDEDPRKTYQRIAAMLARRGFRWDITKEALVQVLQAD